MTTQATMPLVNKGSIWVNEGEFNLFVFIATEDGTVIGGEQFGADATRLAFRKCDGALIQIDLHAYIQPGKDTKIYTAERPL